MKWIYIVTVYILTTITVTPTKENPAGIELVKREVEHEIFYNKQDAIKSYESLIPYEDVEKMLNDIDKEFDRKFYAVFSPEKVALVDATPEPKTNKYLVELDSIKVPVRTIGVLKDKIEPQ